MKKLFFILAAGAVLISCSNKPGYKVKGEVKAPGFSDNTVVYLSDIDPNNPKNTLKVDSTTLVSNSFGFDREFGIIDSIGGTKIIEIVDGDKKMFGKIYTEQGVIQVVVDSISIQSTGTPLNDIQNSFATMNSGFRNEMTPLVRKYRELKQTNGDEAQIEELEDKLNEMQEQQFSQLKDFVKKNATNQVGQEVFGYIAYNLEVPEMEEIVALIPEDTQKNNPQVAKIVDRLAVLKKTAVGSKYINLTGDTPEGSQISLSDYVGKNKLVLVDFWASWCGPCRVAMPSLIKLYNEYHNKGFEIVGVSLDDNKDSWVKGIEELKLVWPQMSDLKGWGTELGKEYAVSSIPYTVLIDQDGTIINIRPNEAKLEELLKTTLK